MGSSIFSNAVSMLALMVSVMAAWFTYSQWHESATPYVDFYVEANFDEQDMGAAVINSGPGLAEVEEISYFVDRKRIANVEAALERFRSGSVYGMTWNPGDHIPVNQKLWLVRISKSGTATKEYEDAADFLQNHFAIRLRYCSIHRECKVACSLPAKCDSASRPGRA